MDLVLKYFAIVVVVHLELVLAMVMAAPAIPSSRAVDRPGCSKVSFQSLLDLRTAWRLIDK